MSSDIGVDFLEDIEYARFEFEILDAEAGSGVLGVVSGAG